MKWAAASLAGLALILFGVGLADRIVMDEAADPTYVCVIEFTERLGNVWSCHPAADQPTGERVYVGPKSGINDAHREADRP